MNDDKMNIPYISRFIDGLTYEQLAEMYELSVSHIKNIVYKHEYTIYNNL